MKYVLAIAVISFTSLANAQSGQSVQKTLLCIAEKSTGFFFDEKSRSWLSTNFNVASEKKYLLKKDSSDWIWSEFGDSSGTTCKAFGNTAFVRCDLLLGTVSVDWARLRFVKTYTSGFISGDNNQDTPHITIGKCSPL